MRPPLHFLVRADDFGSADKTSGAGTKPPRRALKVMRKTEQVLAELNGREGLENKYEWRARTQTPASHIPQPHTRLHEMTSPNLRL